jgi:hypothetical protein
MVVSTLQRSGALPAIELRPLVASQRPIVGPRRHTCFDHALDRAYAGLARLR